MYRKPNTGLRPNASGLPLFLWADSHSVATLPCRKLPPAARRIATRFGLSPQCARVVAELAGFNQEPCYV